MLKTMRHSPATVTYLCSHVPGFVTAEWFIISKGSVLYHE